MQSIEEQITTGLESVNVSIVSATYDRIMQWVATLPIVPVTALIAVVPNRGEDLPIETPDYDGPTFYVCDNGTTSVYLIITDDPTDTKYTHC